MVSPQYEMTGTASNDVSVRMENLIAQLGLRVGGESPSGSHPI